MSTKIFVSMSFEVEGSTELSALVGKLLLGSLDSTVTTTVEPEVKSAKPRKARVMTDEQKAAFRARMIAGRKAKEAAKAAAEAKPVEPKKVAGSKKLSKGGKVTTKKPIPRTGHKVEARPAAQ